MATVRIPGPLRTLSRGEAAIEVGAGDLRSTIEELESRYPGFRERLLDPSGNLRQFVNVYLNDEDIRFGGGLDSKVGERDEVSIIPAVAGGLIRS
ncbi:MAG TPA: MoaD/ThiS family protein [Candidatus Dormibacteraeota bacterium]|nr:MoaD/ThiS family protein [Candidatus Dormibacteraeota bacterium]